MHALGLLLTGFSVGVGVTIVGLGLLARWLKRRKLAGAGAGGGGTDEKQHVGEDVIAIVRNA